MATMTTSTNSNQLHSYYERKLLETLEPRLVCYQLGKKQKLPKGNGKQVSWFRYTEIADNVTPLPEGSPNAELSVTGTKIDATIAQYGQFSKISDLLSDTAIDPVVENLAMHFGRHAAKTIEQLIITEFDAAAAVQFVNNKSDTTLASVDVLSHRELIEAMIRMKAAYIEPHESGDYVCVLNPLSEFDLMADVNPGSWLDISKYVDNKPIMKGEIGRMYGMRFLVSDKASVQAPSAPSTVDRVSSYVLGGEAFGCVELNGSAVKMIRKQLGSAGGADPLDQYSTVGYKIHGFVAKALESGSKRITRIKSSSAIATNP